MQILWLPGWYPNKTEPLAGDFIQRHARAAALYHQVHILYIVRDKAGKFTNNFSGETCLRDNISETIIYYHVPGIPLLEKVLSVLQYRKIYRRAFKTYIAAHGLPSCVHVHVVNKNGLIALWIKKMYKIPFVVSEQWTAYLREAVPNFSSESFLFKALWRKTIQHAAGCTVVSKYLGEAMAAIQPGLSPAVIPNVVDNAIFFPATRNDDVIRFIHISTLGYQKNPEAILQAFAIVKKTNPAFTLSVFGPPRKDLDQMVSDLGLRDQVSFHHEIPQPQLAAFVQKADALILYSRYETFGCVIIEANACGIPVIVSDIPVFHETVQENINGYFVPGENPALLARKIIWFMQQGINATDKKMIAATTEKYTYSRVGKLFSEFYRTVLET